KFRRRMVRLNELLLLLLRMAAIALLVLIFMRPQMPVPASGSFADVVCIVDASLSTSREDAAGLTAFSQEIVALEKAINALHENDAVSVLIAGTVPEWAADAPVSLQDAPRDGLRTL